MQVSGTSPSGRAAHDIHVKKGSWFPPSHQRPNGPLKAGEEGCGTRGEHQSHGGQEDQVILWARKEIAVRVGIPPLPGEVMGEIGPCIG